MPSKPNTARRDPPPDSTSPCRRWLARCIHLGVSRTASWEAWLPDHRDLGAPRQAQSECGRLADGWTEVVQTRTCRASQGLEARLPRCGALRCSGPAF